MPGEAERTVPSDFHAKVDPRVRIVPFASGPAHADGGYETLFLGLPVHGYGVPVPVRRFIQHIPHSASQTAVVFVTFGGWSCGAEHWAARLLSHRGWRVLALLGVKMPHNNPPGVNVAKQPVAQLVQGARAAMAAAIPRVIQANEPVDTRSCAVTLVGSRTNPLFVDHRWMDFSFARRAYADQQCTRCMLCARICPTQSITKEHGTIRFGDVCASCLRCFNQCPAQAIQVGIRTLQAPRYRGPLGDYRCAIGGHEEQLNRTSRRPESI